ncbi:hypothetical protein DAEQUDRAFT_730608 [Daedalea quercina L-15889]|uniref:F-box domain-containing protein n=1 Tax=Daedalea quercina L-15889 TaxID=1314783 RepID=A0A165MTW2_9APHY|nr:hypothetical protein DAEQUDRAFT_730608 [Daedalea quercina L-15889]
MGASLVLNSMCPEHSLQLPLELCDHILCFLSDDLATLASCSLTCRAWLPTTRALTFRTLVVASEGSYRRAERMLADHPHLTRCVRELHIAGASLVVYRSFSELFALVPSLPRLKHLRLHHWAFLGDQIASNRTPPSPRAMFVSVRELTLHIVYPRALDLVRLIRACPNLRALHFSVVLFRDANSLDIDAHSSEVSPPLETMSLETLTWRRSALFLLQWLLRGPAKLRIRNISLAWGEDTKDAAHSSVPQGEEMDVALVVARDTLREAGPTLVRLELCVDCSERHSLVDYGLSSCVNLRTVKLESSYRNRTPSSWAFDWIVHAIRQLNSGVLDSIEVGLGWACDARPIAVGAIESLDHALVDLVKGKPTISIALTVFEWSDELVEEAARGFPGLRAAGVRFCVRMDPEATERALLEAYPSLGDMCPSQSRVRWFP